MKVYLLTQAEKEALLKELELEKFKTPDQFQITDGTRKAQLDAVDSMHRRFHYVVSKYLSDL
jgi:hypothetical protein